MSFQWDVLLLEAGVVAWFLAPARLRAGITERRPPPAVGIWLARLLVWKLMFLSGATKLLAYDDTWWQLTALDYHYYTQPLPWWTSWFMHQLPPWFGKVCVAVTLLIEIGAPWLIFCGRRGAPDRLRAPGRPAARDRLDRQLRVLQSPHHRAVHSAARRSRDRASAADALRAPSGHAHRASDRRDHAGRLLGPRRSAAYSRWRWWRRACSSPCASCGARCRPTIVADRSAPRSSGASRSSCGRRGPRSRPSLRSTRSTATDCSVR